MDMTCAFTDAMPHDPRPADPTPGAAVRVARIAVFGSFYRGYHVLDELLNGPVRQRFHVVGVATDDVSQPYISSGKRVWQYEHRADEETMVRELAQEHGVPVHEGRVKTDGFRRTFGHDWAPDLCIAATFGQRIDEPLFGFPRLGFFNLHPCIEGEWPSPYAGPNPFQALIADGRRHARVALHRVDAGFDTGELIALSPRIAIPPGATVVDMHKLSSPVAAAFAVATLASLVDAAAAAALPASLAR
ncbi:MAG: formyltransferase family protein [Aquabacterium sp.]